jgi:DUF1680 family protein
MKVCQPGKAIITGGFWKKKQDVCTSASVDAIYTQFEKTGRFSALDLSWREGDKNHPHIFFDSDTAKWIESAAYCLALEPRESLKARVEALIDKIELAITPDGYFNSYYQTLDPSHRFTDRSNHELYCVGHLIEAACAYHEVTGDTRFLNLVKRMAEHVYRAFVTEQTATFETPGHEEIELALVRLFKATGEQKFFDLAKHFIDKRGIDSDKQPLYSWSFAGYAQDQAPIAEQRSAQGHAVRFGYLFSGVADVALATSDEALLTACKAVFQDVIEKKMYVTGGIGNMGFGEAFGPEYYLPNYKAYTETCASIALAFFTHRMLQGEPKGEYADVFELQMYNGALAGISIDGTSFFYENPLSQRPADQNFFRAVKENMRPTQRVEYFDCSCCPPNLTRWIASMSQYLYSTRKDTIYVHQFVESQLELEGGFLEQKTLYPWQGHIALTFHLDHAWQGTVALRLPGWCENPTLNYEGTIRDSYFYITREWKNGDTISLELPMEVVEVEANAYVSQDSGRIALKRGPVVYCLEETDNTDRLEDISVASDVVYETKWVPDLLGGVNVISFPGRRRKSFSSLYRKWTPEYEELSLTAIPYYAWANREEGEMNVWIRKNEDVSS